MYKIIAPTDFSEVSQNAIRYAISLIQDYGGQLTLVNYYYSPNVFGHQKLMDEMVKEGVEEEMEKLVETSSQWLGPDQKLESKLVPGDTADGLKWLAKKHLYDLVIMGSQGSVKKIKSFFGSTAKSVIEKVEIPTLIIPPDTHYKKLENFVLADDGSLQDNNLEFLAGLGKLFKGHMHILHIGDVSVNKEMMDHYTEFLKDFSYSFHNVEGSDIIEGINLFAESVNADMIVMTKRRKNFIHKILDVSYTNLELFNSKIPLLILHEHAEF
jgi:nucleotide-binding universal stress UspA family protein